jgi:hypothetical protein
MSAPTQPRIADFPTAQPGPWTPETEEQREAIRQQLARILESHLFANSKRSGKLLQFTVEAVLTGQAEHMKERSLGIDVFQREPDYDTNRDPVVRTTAVEIRKRIAQYYQEARHENEIRISFPAGSYIPEFRVPPGWTPAAVVELPEPITPARLEVVPPRKYGRGLSVAAAIVAIAAVFAGLLWAHPWVTPGALDRFWAPVLSSPGRVLLVIGGGNGVAGSAEASPNSSPATKSIIDLQREERVAFADAATLSSIVGTFMAAKKPFHIRQHKSAKLDDLRDGPVVLIGAFNNEWTIRLGEQARFSFARDPQTQVGRILDRENPAGDQWQVRQADPYSTVAEDYALVSRVQDLTTGRIVVTAAGITKYGTAAAGEFLSEPAYMDAAMRSAPAGWDKKNIQILIATKLVGESSGPPRVLATHLW